MAYQLNTKQELQDHDKNSYICEIKSEGNKYNLLKDSWNSALSSSSSQNLLAINPEIAQNMFKQNSSTFYELKSSLKILKCSNPANFSQNTYSNEFRYGINRFGLFCCIPGLTEEQQIKSGHRDLYLVTKQTSSRLSSKLKTRIFNVLNKVVMQAPQLLSCCKEIVPVDQPILVDLSQETKLIVSNKNYQDEEVKHEEIKYTRTARATSVSKQRKLRFSQSVNNQSECNEIQEESESSYHPESSNSSKIHENQTYCDISQLKGIEFTDVKEIRTKINQIFAPLNVKMICKRAERVYSNSYSVFTLYCNRCSKRDPSYVATVKSYNKRSTNCPFLLKFTRKGIKNNSEFKTGLPKYTLSDGVFYHNHQLDAKVITPEMRKAIQNLDLDYIKPADARKIINSKFSTDITYAQIAYEIGKLKNVSNYSRNS